MNDKTLVAARIALLAAALAAPSVARAQTGPGPAPPLTLAGAMQKAREGAREVVAAEARQQAAQARSDQSKGFRWPSLNLTALWMRTNNPAEVFALKLNQGVFSFPEFVASNPNDASPLNTGITRAEIVLPLFTGGELSGRIDQAKLAADAASGTSTWVADNAALAAAEAYVMVAQAEEYAALLHKSRDTVAAHVKLAGDYVAQGMLVPLGAPEGRGRARPDGRPRDGGRRPRADREREPRVPARRRRRLLLDPRCPARPASRRDAGRRLARDAPPSAPTSARPGSSSPPASSRRR